MTHDEISRAVAVPRESGVSFSVKFDGTGHKHGGGATRGKNGSNVYLVATKGARSATLGFSEAPAHASDEGYAAHLEMHMKHMEEQLA